MEVLMSSGAWKVSDIGLKRTLRRTVEGKAFTKRFIHAIDRQNSHYRQSWREKSGPTWQKQESLLPF